MTNKSNLNKIRSNGSAGLGFSIISINRYYKTVLGIYGFVKDKDLLKLGERMMTMYRTQIKRKNDKFCYLFFKDVYQVLQFSYIGQRYLSTKVMVGVDKDGYPTYIGKQLNKRLKAKESKMLFLAVSTLLGVHRIIGGGPKPDLSTITKPFKGLNKTLDNSIIVEAYNKLLNLARKKANFKLSIKSSSLLSLRSASPSSKDSLRGVLKDTFILLVNYRHLVKTVKGYHMTKSYTTIFILFGSLIISILYGAINFSEFKHYELGKISIVRNVAGKSRVIGITNYGIQVALEPLHTAILSFLKSLETDGTFDQLKPIKLLKMKGRNFSSLDLSAATDRLPLDIQSDCIRLFTNDKTANLGKELITFTLHCDIKGIKQNTVDYSVGQPMGAYSSGASLALTHHMIVQMSVPGKAYTNRYAVLGDDIVIDDMYRNNYLKFMNSLGVEIQTTKSLFKDKFIEFAKRIINLDTYFNDDYSIIGPKLILSSIKNPYYKIDILFEMFKRSYINLGQLLDKTSTLSDTKKTKSGMLSQGAISGPCGLARFNLSTVPFEGKDRFLNSGPRVLYPSEDLTIHSISENIYRGRTPQQIDDMKRFSLLNQYYPGERSIFITYYVMVTDKYFAIMWEALKQIYSLFHLPQRILIGSLKGGKKVYRDVTLRETINHVLLLISPFALVHLKSNIMAAFSAMKMLRDHGIKGRNRGYALIEDMVPLLHPELVGSKVDKTIDFIRSRDSFIRKFQKALLETQEVIEIDGKLKAKICKGYTRLPLREYSFTKHEPNGLMIATNCRNNIINKI